MNYDINMIKYRKSGFFRIAAAILMICFTLLGLTACAGTTDSKDNNDDNALIQGTWEIDVYKRQTGHLMNLSLKTGFGSVCSVVPRIRWTFCRWIEPGTGAFSQS